MPCRCELCGTLILATEVKSFRRRRHRHCYSFLKMSLKVEARRIVGTLLHNAILPTQEDNVIDPAFDPPLYGTQCALASSVLGGRLRYEAKLVCFFLRENAIAPTPPDIEIVMGTALDSSQEPIEAFSSHSDDLIEDYE